MKFFAFIMAVIVLALSCIPCCDVSATCERSKMEIKGSQDNETQQGDVCSPFCACTCCAGFSINYKVPGIQSLPKLLDINYSPSYFSALIKIALPIWQPPQLV